MACTTASSAMRYPRQVGAQPRGLLPEEDNSLTRRAIRVWYALAHRGALAGWLDFSPSRLAAEIGMCRASFFAALKELKMKHFIVRGRVGRLTRAHCVAPRSVML